MELNRTGPHARDFCFSNAFFGYTHAMCTHAVECMRCSDVASTSGAPTDFEIERLDPSGGPRGHTATRTLPNSTTPPTIDDLVRKSSVQALPAVFITRRNRYTGNIIYGRATRSKSKKRDRVLERRRQNSSRCAGWLGAAGIRPRRRVLGQSRLSQHKGIEESLILYEETKGLAQDFPRVVRWPGVLGHGRRRGARGT